MQITLKAARVNAGLTQKELAEKIGKNVGTIINWESEKTKINISDFRKICSILGVKEEDIFLKTKSS